MEAVDFSKFKNELQIARGINSFSQEKQANKSQEIGRYNYLNRRNQVLPKTVNSINFNREQEVFTRQQNEVNSQNEELKQRIFLKENLKREQNFNLRNQQIAQEQFLSREEFLKQQDFLEQQRLVELQKMRMQEVSDKFLAERISKEQQEVIDKFNKIIKKHERIHWMLVFTMAISLDILDPVLNILDVVPVVGVITGVMGVIFSFSVGIYINYVLWRLGEEKITPDELSILEEMYEDEKISLGQKVGEKAKNKVKNVANKFIGKFKEKAYRILGTILNAIPILGALPWISILSVWLPYKKSKEEVGKAQDALSKFYKRLGKIFEQNS